MRIDLEKRDKNLLVFNVIGPLLFLLLSFVPPKVTIPDEFNSRGQARFFAFEQKIAIATAGDSQTGAGIDANGPFLGVLEQSDVVFADPCVLLSRVFCHFGSFNDKSTFNYQHTGLSPPSSLS